MNFGPRQRWQEIALKNKIITIRTTYIKVQNMQDDKFREANNYKKAIGKWTMNPNERQDAFKCISCFTKHNGFYVLS